MAITRSINLLDLSYIFTILSLVVGVTAQSEEVSTVTAPAVTLTSVIDVPAPTKPPSPEYTNSTLFRLSLLNNTNLYRYEHSAPFLSWNESLAEYATNYAQLCEWAHSDGAENFGENLARGYDNVTQAVDAWGKERLLYDYGNGDGKGVTGFTEKTGHFTQLVWKQTRTVGCAAHDCGDGNGKGGVEGWFLVCEYWPGGNNINVGDGGRYKYFAENVSPEREGGSNGYNETEGSGLSTSNGTTTETGTGNSQPSTNSGVGVRSEWMKSGQIVALSGIVFSIAYVQ